MSSDDTTKDLVLKKPTLDDAFWMLDGAYTAPADFVAIMVINPITHEVENTRYTDYEVKMKTNLPVFQRQESSVRRRYSDFEWLENELKRDTKIVVPSLPSIALRRQLPFRSDDGIFEESFIEERRSGLEAFIKKVASNPLARDKGCLHMFLQEPVIDRSNNPSKMYMRGVGTRF